MAILAADLAEEHARLDTLVAGDDGDTAVRAVFSWSYRNLPTPDARMFRLLGLHAGTHISADAAAALAGLPVRQARRLLEALANGHLVEQTQPGRFRLHDLIRLYAVEQVLAEEPDDARHQALQREHEWYMRTADAAGRALAPRSHLVPPPRADLVPQETPFDCYQQALEWCEIELGNVAAIIRQAADNGAVDIAWQLPVALFEFLHVRKPWRVWQRTYTIGLASARASGSQYGEACMLHGLGLVSVGLHRLDDALDHIERASSIRQRIDDRPGQAWSQTALGWVCTSLGRFDDAAAHLDNALAVHREIGDQQGEAVTLIYLADVHRARDDIDKALCCSQQALTIARAIGDQHSEGLALHQLGDACAATNRSADALNYLHQALDIRCAAGDSKGKADTLFLLGLTRWRAGQPEQGCEHLRDALTIFEDRGDPTVSDVLAALDQLDAARPEQHYPA